MGAIMNLSDQILESRRDPDGWLARVQRTAPSKGSSSPHSDAEAFMKAVLPTVGRYRIQYRPRGELHPNRTQWISSPAEAARVARELDAGPAADVYVSMASFQPQGGGDHNSILFKRGFYLDIDCGPGKSYPDKKSAADALWSFCADTEIPSPAILVDSGNGLHAHWPVDRDLSLSEWQEAAAALKQACRAGGAGRRCCRHGGRCTTAADS